MQSDEHLLAATATNSTPSARAGLATRRLRLVKRVANAQGATDPLVTPHPQYLALHAEDTARQRRYRDWVQAAITPEDVDEIRRRLQCQHAFGTEHFRQMIEEQLQRRAGPAKIGRPRKSAHQEFAESAL